MVLQASAITGAIGKCGAGHVAERLGVIACLVGLSLELEVDHCTCVARGEARHSLKRDSTGGHRRESSES